MDVVQIYLKACNLPDGLAQDKSEWRNNIHIADHNIVGTSFDDDDDDESLMLYRMGFLI